MVITVEAAHKRPMLLPLALEEYGLCIAEGGTRRSGARLDLQPRPAQLPPGCPTSFHHLVGCMQVTTRIGGNKQQQGGTGGGGGGQLTAALGTKWAHCVNVRLVLERVLERRFLRVRHVH